MPEFQGDDTMLVLLASRQLKRGSGGMIPSPWYLITCTASASRSVPLARHGLSFRVHRARPLSILQSGALSSRAYAPNVHYPTVGLSILGDGHELGYAHRESKAAAPASVQPFLFHYTLVMTVACSTIWVPSMLVLFPNTTAYYVLRSWTSA